MVVGAAVGAAAASSNTAAATGAAYNAGVATGAAMASAPAYVVGVNYASLRAGCTAPNVGGHTYYHCDSTWFQPQYGANGVFYKVVPTP